jgi:hypothetical protein
LPELPLASTQNLTIPASPLTLQNTTNRAETNKVKMFYAQIVAASAHRADMDPAVRLHKSLCFQCLICGRKIALLTLGMKVSGDFDTAGGGPVARRHSGRRFRPTALRFGIRQTAEGKLADARATLQTWSIPIPQDPLALQAKGAIDATLLFEEGQARTKAGKYETARVAFETLIAVYPENPAGRRTPERPWRPLREGKGLPAGGEVAGIPRCRGGAGGGDSRRAGGPGSAPERRQPCRSKDVEQAEKWRWRRFWRKRAWTE